MSRPRATIHAADEGEFLSFHGIPVRLVATGDQTGDHFMASVGISKSGGSAPPHAHSFDEGFYLLEGEMTFRARGEEVTLSAGDFIQIRGDEPHQPINRSNGDARLLTIGAPAGFDGFQRAVSQPMDGPDGDPPRVPANIQEQMEEAASEFGIRFGVADDEFEGEPAIRLTRKGEGQSIAAVGDVYRFLATSQDTGGRYAIWHATVFPGGGPPPHIHRNEEEFFYILDGELAVFDDDGEKVTVGEDTAITLPRGSRHWFRNETDTPVEALILVAPAGLETMFEKSGLAWSIEDGAPPHPSDAEKRQLGEIAPSYGIELG